MAKRMREKAAARAENAEKRPNATASYVRMSASKARIVLDIIRGARYTDAIAILMHTPKGASKTVLKVLQSAGANAENNLNLSKDDLFVAECYANEGPTLKRWWPRSHGSADTINKRTCHITIILDEKKVEKPVAKPKAAKAASEKSLAKPIEAAEVKEEKPVKTEKPKTTTKTTSTTKSQAKPAVKSTKGGAK